MSALVNGKFFDWGDITISLLPFSPALVSVREISYDEELETEIIYGKGKSPIGFGKGNWKASGRLTLVKHEFENLAALAPTGILNLDPRIVSINIIFSSSGDSTLPLNTQTLTGIRFTKISDKASQNDKTLLTNLDFVILGNVLRNGKAARGL